MTRLLAAFAFTLIATVATAAAQEPSITQMQLVSSSIFTTRLQYVGVQVAKEVLEEVANGAAATPITYTTACHSMRVELARSWMQSPAQMASVAAVHVAGTNEAGAVIVGTVVTGADGAKDSSASDLALKVALRFKWSAMARCVTNP